MKCTRLFLQPLFITCAQVISANEFVKSLDAADEVILLPIYSARELLIEEE